MNIKNDNWIILEILSLKEKEMLFLTLESAGMSIYPPTRAYEEEEIFKWVAKTRENFIVSCGRNSHPGCIPVNYEFIMEELRKIIRE